MEICEIKRCNRFAYLSWYGRDVCYRHWQKHADDNDPFNFKTIKNFRPPKDKPIKPIDYVTLWGSEPPDDITAPRVLPNSTRTR